MFKMKEYKKLICERKGKDGEALWVTLNDEKMMNAITPQMQDELLEILGDIAFDNSVRCVVLIGAGEKSFSSGGDIEFFKSLDNVSAYDFLYRGTTIKQMMTNMEKPIICAVNGYCFAGGMELALSCDFIYATEKSKFGLLEVNLGLLAGWGGTMALPRKIPVNKAREMVYRGEILNAADAYQWGLVNRVVSTKEELVTEVEKIVTEMMSKPPLAVRAAKNVINQSITCDSMEAAMAIERGAVAWLFLSDDVKEGVAAFMEKRKPVFKGK